MPTEKVKGYTLIGHPLGHTMSPFIHKKLFALSGIHARYDCTDFPPEMINDIVPEMNKLEGYNVTIPYKTSVIPFLDELDESAKRYNAVNCVVNKKGKTIGYNTDCDGFLRTVRGYPLGAKVLILGCGGVGRMMALEAAAHDADITIAIVEEARDMADKLLGEINTQFPDVNAQIVLISEITGNYEMLINATPVGMYPYVDLCPVPDSVILRCDTVFDAIYNPVKTQLVTKALGMGKRAKGGMAMLVYQAVKAHEIWHDGSYKTEDIDALISECEKIVGAEFK